MDRRTHSPVNLSAPLASTAPPAAYDFHQLPGYSQLTLKLHLNDVSWGDVEQIGGEILRRLDQSENSPVLVDLSPLVYIGSAQVALLVRIWKVIKARDGRMVVLVPAADVHKVLTIAGLHTLWDIVITRDAALELVKPTPKRSETSIAIPLIGGATAVLLLCGELLLRQSGLLVLGSRPHQIAVGMMLALTLFGGLWSAVRGAGVLRGFGLGVLLAGVLIGMLASVSGPGKTSTARSRTASRV